MQATTNHSVAHVTTTRLHTMAVGVGVRGGRSKSLGLWGNIFIPSYQLAATLEMAASCE